MRTKGAKAGKAKNAGKAKPKLTKKYINAAYDKIENKKKRTNGFKDKPLVPANALPYNQMLHDELCYRLARDAVLEWDIAEKIGISYGLFQKWQENYPSFSASLKKGRLDINKAVEGALAKRALGFSYDEITISTKNGMTTRKVNVIPDVGAICFWLKNRLPEEWKDKQESGFSFPPHIMDLLARFFER